MTKREFDKQTKINYGAYMGGRTRYKLDRGYDLDGRDRLAERAWLRRRHPHVPTLGLGSRLRAPVQWRLMGRLPRLPLTREERAALAR